MRVLIVKLSSFGDVVHTFPALTDLREARPDVEVDWLVEEAFAPFVRLHPGVAEVHTLAFRRLRTSPRLWPSLGRDMLAVRRRLHARRYDLVVDLQGLMKSALAARLAGAPVAGYDETSAREPAATYFYRRRIAVPKTLHAVERTRRLLATALGLAVPSGQGDFGLAAVGAPPPGLPLRYALVLHAASWPSKLWPEPRWRSLIEGLLRDGRSVVLPWGGGEEKARAERLAAGLDGVVVLPRVMAGAELAAVIGNGEVAVGLDSGLMHLAAALGVPGLWLFGPTDPGLTGPYGDGQVVIRSTYAEAPCYRRTCDRTPDGLCCMSSIGLDAVRAAMVTLGAQNPRSPREEG